jgi:hypothetical protein
VGFVDVDRLCALVSFGGFWLIVVGGAFWWVLVDSGEFSGVSDGFWWALVGSGEFW